MGWYALFYKSNTIFFICLLNYILLYFFHDDLLIPPSQPKLELVTDITINYNALPINTSNLQFIHSFPKLIHFICISDNINDNNQLDTDQQHQHIDTFYKLYSQTGWEIMVWTNKNVQNILCKQSTNSKACKILFTVNNSTTPNHDISLSLKSDFLKYLILYSYGGVYFDTNLIAKNNSLQKIIQQRICKNELIVCNQVDGKSLVLSSHFFACYPQNKAVEMAKNHILKALYIETMPTNVCAFERLGFWKRALIATRYNNPLLIYKHKGIDRLLFSFNISDIATQVAAEYIYTKSTQINYELININNNNTFTSSVSLDYPFRKEWYFDYYQVENPEKLFKSIQKFSFPSLLINSFKYKYETVETFPFYNPSIIRIDVIPNYRNFMLSSLTKSERNIYIVSETVFIMIGRWVNHQCRESHYFPLFDNVDEELTGSGVILFDKDWNILLFVSLQLNYDNSLDHDDAMLDSEHFKLFEDCRLFHYLSLVYTNCGSYEDAERFDWHPRSYLGALLWIEDKYTHQIKVLLEGRMSANISELLKTKRINHFPSDDKFGLQAKNLIPLVYEEKLYFQWELQHSYWIEIDLFNNNMAGQRTADYSFHSEQAFTFHAHNLSNVVHEQRGSYHLNTGFVYLPATNEYLGIGHAHYDLYDLALISRPFSIQHGFHYTHFFYTINDKPPFKVKRMTDEFCFVSSYLNTINSTKSDCEIVQFVTGMVENIIDEIEYLFVSYGINDCTASVAKIEKKFIINMLEFVTY